MNHCHSAPRDRGFTLIEMLVAMALIGLGLLGVAALQLEAARANQDAFQRTQAIIALMDLAERVRMAHPAFAAAGSGIDGSRILDDQAIVDDWQAELDRLGANAGPTKLNASLDCSGGGDCGNQGCRILIEWKGQESESREPDGLHVCLGMP